MKDIWLVFYNGIEIDKSIIIIIGNYFLGEL